MDLIIGIIIGAIAGPTLIALYKKYKPGPATSSKTVTFSPPLSALLPVGAICAKIVVTDHAGNIAVSNYILGPCASQPTP